LPDNSDAEQMLSEKEVASLLNIRLNTVRRWNKLGILKSYRISLRGDPGFRTDDIATFSDNRDKITKPD
jgi:predicted site-specific integrase-resolvase